MLRNAILLALLLVMTTTFALAGGTQVPEVDASTGLGALTLLAGGFLILRTRRR